MPNEAVTAAGAAPPTGSFSPAVLATGTACCDGQASTRPTMINIVP